MKKTLIALAVLGVAGVAQAQSNVTIYGAVDINYVKSTGNPVTMDERYNNRLGFMGTEDLGGGLKATFQLEHRFDLTTGQSKGRGDFEGAANVGLAGAFGQVRFGRVNELSTETFRVIDPFQQYGVAGMIETPLRGNDGEGRLSYTTRYDSPVFNGFKFGASYTLKNNPDASLDYYGFGNSGDAVGTYKPNNGYALSATYTNGPVYLVANYNKAVNAWGAYNWNVGGAYAFGPAKLSLGYEQTRAKDFLDLNIKSWIVGASYTIGNGVINASYTSADMTGVFFGPFDGTQTKYGVGYTHNLSKRTALYANYAHTKFEDSYYIPSGGGIAPGVGSSSSYELGITHKF